MILLLIGAGCDGGDVDIFVDLKTDLFPGIEFTGVEVVFDEGAVIAHVPSEDIDYLGGVRVAETRLAPGRHTLELRLVRGVDRVFVRPAVMTVDGPHAMTIMVTRDCRGVACPGADEASATACLGGSCVAPECVPEIPEACPAPACTADIECAPADACSTRRCIHGVCFYDDAGTCSATTYCDPEAGCLTRPTMLDGGVQDGDGFVWASPVGSAGLELEFGLAPGGSNMVVGGSARGDLVFPEAIVGGGGDEAVLAGFGADGSHLWTRLMSTAENESVFDVVGAGDGSDVYVAGLYSDAATLGAGEPPLPITGLIRVFVLRVDAATGATVGMPFTVGADSTTVSVAAIASSGPGEVVLALRAMSDLNIAGVPIIGASSAALTVIAGVGLDPVPALRWSYVIASDQVLLRALSAPSGSVAYVAGTFSGSVTLPGGMLVNDGASEDGFVLRLEDGDLTWARTFTSPQDVEVAGLAAPDPTSVHVALSHGDSLTVEGGPTLGVGADIINAGAITTYDSRGAHSWTTRIEGTSYASVGGVSGGLMGEVLATGARDSRGFVVRLARDSGDSRGEVQLLHSDVLIGGRVRLIPSGEICVSGNFQGGEAGDRLVAAGSIDAYVGCVALLP